MTLSSPHIVLVGLLVASAGCRKLPQDPDGSGVAIWPDPGTWEGPTDLIVVSRRGEPTPCEVVVDDGCPDASQFADALTTLDPRERVVLQDVTCLTIDVVCLPDGADAATAPLRTWSWEVLPPLDEDEQDDEDDVAFDGTLDPR